MDNPVIGTSSIAFGHRKLFDSTLGASSLEEPVPSRLVPKLSEINGNLKARQRDNFFVGFPQGTRPW